MESDRGFVENVEHIDQLRTDLRREAYALALAARQRARGACQREVAQAHLQQELRALADLLHDLAGDRPLLVVHLPAQPPDPAGELVEREGRDLGDVAARNAELQRLGLQARAVARRAPAIGQELLAPLAAAGRIVVLGAGDVLGHALPGRQTRAARRRELRNIDRQGLRIAVEYGVHAFGGDGFHGVVHGETVAAAQRLKDGEEHTAAFAQRLHGTSAQRLAAVGNDLVGIEHRLLAQSVAAGTRPLGRIEGEGMRRRVLECHPCRGAHQVARIVAHPLRAVVVDGHRALALAHGLAQRGQDALRGVGPGDQAVDHQVDRMDLVAVELHAGRDLADLAVDAGIEVALFRQRLEEFAVVALAPLDHGGQQRDFAPGEPLQDQLGNAVVAVVDHLLARLGRIGPRGASVEQTQEVVDLGHGAYRRAGVLVGRLLLDGHHGAQARDLVHIRTLHRPHELSRIGRERLHVAALPLGIDRVERQRGLARAAQARDDDQFAARNLQVHVLQVVHPRTEYLDFLLSLHIHIQTDARHPSVCAAQKSEQRYEYARAKASSLAICRAGVPKAKPKYEYARAKASSLAFCRGKVPEAEPKYKYARAKASSLAICRAGVPKAKPKYEEAESKSKFICVFAAGELSWRSGAPPGR